MADKTKVRFRIDLDQSRAPRAYRGKANLWEDDLGRIYRLVDSQVQTLEERRQRGDGCESGPEDLPHLSIAIFGPSGSGKSSLLRTLTDDVGRKHGGILRQRESLKGKIYALPGINPTTWSKSDQFLYAFLATALEEERKYQERKERKEHHRSPEGLSRVQLAFQDVNEYLRVVDVLETSEEHDPLGLSLQKLERHTSGLRLREALEVFVEELATELKANVVLLPVDDLDMAPQHLVESLQAYQSFLTHPRLVPVFTFTDRMPEELIEAHYEHGLAIRRTQHQVEEATGRLPISQQLAVQFLSRCFPVRNRIRLGPAPARVQRAIFDLPSEEKEQQQVKRTAEEKEKLEVLELLTIASFLLFGHPDEEDAHKVRAILRPSTLRRQFQVVDAMADCRIPVFRSPQLAHMLRPKIDAKDLERLATDREPEQKTVITRWDGWPKDDNHLGRLWDLESGRILAKFPKSKGELRLLVDDRRSDFLTQTLRLECLKSNATWASVFSGAAWSLLNVHRDTLRELGLFLEDLYSWSPKELRTVVLGKILASDRVIRRTVIDRWFNRTDFRRSQVLSLLAANIFRPWMIGEEPYGDEERAIREQLRLDSGKSCCPDKETDEHVRIRDRLTFPGTQGLLWFLNVTLGFYLPQTMARNWADAMPLDESVKGRMSGNGWDLHYAPVNAMRVAAANQEISSFGMLFLDPVGYRHALKAVDYPAGEASGVWKGKASPEGHLLLRIWSCCGYSRSRYWAAFSLWRGLGFIGQVLELAWKENRRYEDAESEQEREDAREYLCGEIRRLIHSHCLSGLVPGSLLDRDSNERRLLHAFPRWEPLRPEFNNAIEKLARKLVAWLHQCWADRIFPLPAGEVWIGWSDCFIRRIHGEYILGALWPRLNAAYQEEHKPCEECRCLAHRRAFSETRKENALKEQRREPEERFRWTAALAADVWSDTLLEYWRGCPAILRLLLTCPAFFKSRERFDTSYKGATPVKVFKKLRGRRVKIDEDDARYKWLKRLSIPQEVWQDLTKDDGTPKEGISEFVPDELCVERVRIRHFASLPVQRQSIAIQHSKIELGQEESGKRTIMVSPTWEEYPKLPEEDS